MIGHKNTGLALVAILALLANPGSARAQTVAVEDGAVEIFDTDDDTAVRIDNGADYTAGGNGRTATLTLRGSDGPATLQDHAFTAELIIGGGTHEGIILLKDDDGITTTIELDGRTGAIELGANGEDGDLVVNDGSASTTIRLNGAAGTVTNQFSGNGLIKAWARIGSAGGVVDCWRCNSANTSRVAPGVFVVSFDPLGTDIRARPRSVTLDTHTSGSSPAGLIRVTDNNATTDTVVVITSDATGANADRSFTVFIY